MMSSPDASTAMVRPPASRAAVCAIVSIPSANPLTIVTWPLARSDTMRSVTCRPYVVEVRVPTTAMANWSASVSLPYV